MALIEALGATTLILIILFLWLFPFILAARHLAKINRPMPMKVLWAISFILFGLIAVIAYLLVVYLPERKKLKESKEDAK
jgi:hypothetical protein